MVKKYANLKQKRQARVRYDIFGTSMKPRVSVFRSNNYIYVQAIDDEKRVTIAHSSSKKIEGEKKKMEKAFMVGQEIGEKLAKAKVKVIVFDRGPYKYHGNVKNLADGIRDKGIKF
jgi:large subunit ribosomal protein L18